jgi:hypothetical protein
MRCPWTAVLCCLALLSATPPASADGVSAGRISLAVAQSGGVALAIDLDALARDLCDGSSPTLRASAECGLTVANFPPDNGQAHTAVGLEVGDAQLGEPQTGGDRRASVEVTPRAIALAGTALLRTPCGPWQYSLLLDPAAVQAAAPLTLHPAAKRPAQGMLAGVIEVAALLHLVPLDGSGHPDESAAIDLPFDFTLQLAGAWATAPDPLPDPSDSNLLLFAGFAQGEWLSRPGCQWTIFDGVWCEACVEVAPDVLLRFNEKLPPAGGSPPFQKRVDPQ